MPLRSALMVFAALTASSVAPAKVAPAPEPLIEDGSTKLAAVAASALLGTENSPTLLTAPADELAPLPAIESLQSIDPSASLADLVTKYRGSVPGSRELECLAGAIFFESKSESLQGQLAVGHVIANRANSGGRFPSSYCGVVFQHSQFSFVRGRSLPSIPRAGQQWKNAVAIARIVDEKIKPTPVGKALFFHARRVSPGWRLTRIATLGNHVFYR
ncbi:cell wall hydrolase [Sphingomonas sp.]|uniref:cell wall hydrolase n=1 Tax=Sphingomonas sp. TaxID=28214 RepID=UPI0025E827F3|nr:cell wall hydrolase [Sphingomonas sp.]